MLSKLKSLFIFFLFLTFITNAQEKGKVAGKIADASTGEELIGVAVGVKGTSQGTSTDIEGNYILPLPPGTYVLVFSYVGYKSQEITDVVIEAGKINDLDIALGENVTELEEVVVTFKAAQASTDALMLERKNSVSVSDGVSAELIKKTPDRSTSDVIKRITGASIQDNKFVIIRGLNDRYNASFINGAPLPSTEADRKAFSFDIFPANLLDKLEIIKTATPDQTGDFGGGVINLTTKDIPQQAFLDISVGGTNNSITTYNKFYQLPKGKNEWLGLDNGYRQVPEGVPGDDAPVWATLSSQQGAEKARIAELFPNNWAPVVRNTKMFGDKVSPGYNFQLSAGTPIRSRFGVVGAVTYRRSFNISQQERRNYGREQGLDGAAQQFSESYLTQYKDNVSAGVMLNFGANLNDFNKITLKNNANVLSEDLYIPQIYYATGSSGERQTPQVGYINTFTSNIFISNQLSGDHFIPSSKLKVNWNAGHSSIERDIPDFKRLKYNLDTVTQKRDLTLAAGNPNEESGSRLYSKTKETVKNFGYSVSRDINIGIIRNNIKVGGYHQFRERRVTSTMFNMIYNRGNTAVTDSLKTLPENSIFDTSNIARNRFLMVKFPGTYKWNYYANSLINAGYFMLDHKIGDLRIIWGVRFESFSPRLSGYESSVQPLNIDTVVVDKLPSLNLVYSLNKRSNLRVSYSQTINRPEFREFSTFAFYDPILQLNLQGNPKLVRAYIYNYDVRYEFFPGAGQVISLTGFYKKFENPIENVLNLSAGTITWENASSASSFGAEFEIRQTLQSLLKSPYKIFQFTTLFANLALIKTQVDLTNIKIAQYNPPRPLQGQSPYIVNCGLLFTEPKTEFNINIAYNRFGRRIFLVQSEGQGLLDIYENPRSVFDIQLSKAFKLKSTGKAEAEIKLNFNDVFAQDFVFYQDVDKNGKYTKGKDYIFNKYTVGRNISLSLGLKF